MEALERSRIRQKVFTFKTCATWTGGRSATVAGEGKPALAVRGRPELKPENDLWSSEDMFVAAVELCHMATFLSAASKERVPVLSYKSHANGVLEYVDGDYRFTRIVIFPTITVSNPAMEAQVHALLCEAQKHCMVANSIASLVEVNPTIMVE